MFKQNRFLFFAGETPESNLPPLPELRTQDEGAESATKAPEVPAQQERADAATDAAAEVSKPGLIETADQLKKTLGDKIHILGIPTDDYLMTRIANTNSQISISKQLEGKYIVSRKDIVNGVPKYTNITPNYVSREEAARILKNTVQEGVQKVDDLFAANATEVEAANKLVAAKRKKREAQKNLLEKKSELEKAVNQKSDAEIALSDSKEATAKTYTKLLASNKQFEKNTEALSDVQKRLKQAQEQYDRVVSSGIYATEAANQANNDALAAINREAALNASDPNVRADRIQKVDYAKDRAKELGSAEAWTENAEKTSNSIKEEANIYNEALAASKETLARAQTDRAESVQKYRSAIEEDSTAAKTLKAANEAVPPAQNEVDKATRIANSAANKFQSAQTAFSEAEGEVNLASSFNRPQVAPAAPEQKMVEVPTPTPEPTKEETPVTPQNGEQEKASL